MWCSKSRLLGQEQQVLTVCQLGFFFFSRDVYTAVTCHSEMSLKTGAVLQTSKMGLIELVLLYLYPIISLQDACCMGTLFSKRKVKLIGIQWLEKKTVIFKLLA